MSFSEYWMQFLANTLEMSFSGHTVLLSVISFSKLEYILKRKNMIRLVGVFCLLISLANSLLCTQGSVPNPLSICISPRYIEGCNQYLSETQCKTCDYRYLLNGDGLCEIDKQNTQNCCAQRAADRSCLVCKRGLYLIGGKCRESNILGCLQKDNKGVCLNCAEGFLLKNGVCQKAIKNCVQYSDDKRTICTQCRRSYSLIENFCLQNKVLGCKNELNHVCKECYKPYTLSNGNCEINNCKAYNQYKCVACNCGYYLSTHGVCLPIQVGCIRYQRGQCTDCLPGFKLKGSICDMEGCKDISADLTCNQCESGYEKVEGVCEMKNCLSWKDSQCLVCKPGFNYQYGKCISRTPTPIPTLPSSITSQIIITE